MNKELSRRKPYGKVVVVTGAAAGVGRAIAREFGRERARIGLIARSREDLEEAKREILSLGGRAIVLPVDVSNAQALERAAQKVEDAFGPIQIWINNAMVSVFSPVVQTTPAEYKRVTEVTYLGYVYGTLAALRRMKPRNRGVIIQIGSALAYRSIPLQSAYCAAKHAIAGFTESLRTELLHDRSRVQVCQINLPAVNTPQFDWAKSRMPRQAQPVPPIYQPEMIARAVRFIARHPRRRLDIAFPTLKANLGEKFAAAYADRYLARHGYESQQTHEAIRRPRRDNLWSPVPGRHSAHGRFDSRARSFSLWLWLDLHRKVILGSAVVAVLGMGVWTFAGVIRGAEGVSVRPAA